MRCLKIASVLLVSVVLFGGCDSNMLDIQNPNQATTETFWESGQDAVKGTNAAYGALRMDGMYSRWIHNAQDFRSDLVLADSPWGELESLDDFSYGPISYTPEIVWDHAYIGIYRANQVINNVPDIEMDQQLRDRLVAEAKFIRAHNYFKLLKLFRNVPLVTEPVEADDIEQPQAAPSEVRNQIIQDLTDAQSVLPESYENDTGRATSGAATAYLGKVYLFNEQFEDADAEFAKIIDSDNYELVDNPRWNGDLQHEHNSESIFEVNFTNQGGGNVVRVGAFDAYTPTPEWANTQLRSRTWSAEGYGWADSEPNQALFNDLNSEKTVDGEDDPRLHATMYYNSGEDMTIYGDNFQDVYSGQIEAGGNPIYWRKYQLDRPGGEPRGNALNIRPMRYADVLLMYAETRNELGDQETAAEHIQQVRDRSEMPDRESEFANLSQSAMRERIAHERVVELAGEGKRFDDLRRWGWLDDQQRLQELANRNPGFEGYTDSRKYLPIPQNEIDTNPAIEQNPGY
jgi:tetratricopeptide (TPR) repeat protein